jgi:hypothetical protein
VIKYNSKRQWDKKTEGVQYMTIWQVNSTPYVMLVIRFRGNMIVHISNLKLVVYIVNKLITTVFRQY